MKPMHLERPGPKPPWIRIRLETGPEYQEVRHLMRGLALNTVCEEARCPNIYECWGDRTATFMILGDVCTRTCGFCAVTSGRPRPGVDAGEPERLAEAVERLGLDHVVVTSVDRDDLPDGGAGHFARVIRAVRARRPECGVEVLTPDFRNVPEAASIILAEEPVVFSHNLETVPRLYRAARPGSRFERSTALLAEAAAARGRADRPLIKTGLMVGLGETRDELLDTFRAARDAGVEILTIGQYLRPTLKHLPVERYMPPDEFAVLATDARGMGFKHVEAGPLVRSSYHAKRHTKTAAAAPTPVNPAP
ncbi:MAG TPA: lipoyl synthase [Candidatus Polarisedimenticolia bacterium]|nr:lipoyl synthase [Candidatus Polarisedimenticolia bacterium]